MKQVQLMKKHCQKLAAQVQKNSKFKALKKRIWEMPKPNTLDDSATLSRKICFHQPLDDTIKPRSQNTVRSPGDADDAKFNYHTDEHKLSLLRSLGRKTKLIGSKNLKKLENKSDKTKIAGMKKLFKKKGIDLEGLAITKANMDMMYGEWVKETTLTSPTLNPLKKSKKSHSFDDKDTFEETPDKFVYHAEHKYLWIHLETMRHRNVRIDLSMFDALYIKYCFIEVVREAGQDVSNISVTLTTSNKELYIHHMLCIKGVKHLHFADECIIKSAQIWLLQNQNVLVFPGCRLSAITTWVYQCKTVVNNGTLLNISNCWINGGDTFENAEEGMIKSYGYLYLNMRQIENKNRIESDIFYHVVANRYEDTGDSSTHVADSMYFNIQERCHVEGIFSARSWLLNVGNQLKLSSNRIMIDRLFYVQCKHGKFIKENVMVGLMSRSHMHLNIVDSHHNNAYKIYGCHDHAMRFAQYMTEEATLCIKADSLSIEYGEIECEILSLHVRNLSISSKKLHITNKLRIEFKDKEEAILLNDGDILIRPFVDAKAQCMLSADQSTMMISIQHYEMMTRMKDCRLNIMNVTNAQINHCNIECYDMYFMNARDVRCSNASVIDCLHMFVCNEMDDFNLVNQSTIVAKEKEAIIDVINSFCVDKTSKVYIDNEQCLINATLLRIEPKSESAIRTTHTCNITADTAVIHADIESPVLLLTINTLSISSKMIHIAKKLSIEFKDKKEAILLNDGNVLIHNVDESAM
eukprot:847622_1